MAKSRFYILESAEWEVPRNQIIRPETPEIEAQNLRMILPSYCVLIEHPTLGRVLYDTGIAEDYAAIWPDEMLDLYRFDRLRSLRDSLAALQLTPADIDLIIMSHLHYDHAGNLRLFAGTKAGQKVLVSAAELTDAVQSVEASANGVSGAYFGPEFNGIAGISYETVSGDTVLAEGLELIALDGHTRGLLGLLVETENTGTVLFPSDAVYTALHYGPPIVYPSLCMNPEAYKANIERLEEIRAARNGTIFFSHDIDAYRMMKKAPDCYD